MRPKNILSDKVTKYKVQRIGLCRFEDWLMPIKNWLFGEYPSKRSGTNNLLIGYKQFEDWVQIIKNCLLTTVIKKGAEKPIR